MGAAPLRLAKVFQSNPEVIGAIPPAFLARAEEVAVTDRGVPRFGAQEWPQTGKRAELWALVKAELAPRVLAEVRLARAGGVFGLGAP